MSKSLVERLRTVENRLELQQTQQDIEDQAEKAEGVAFRIEHFADQVVDLAGTVRRCARQIAPDRRSAFSNWSRVREHFATLCEQVSALPEKAEAVLSSQYARSPGGGKRPQSLVNVDAALGGLWADHVKVSTGSLRATLELVRLVPYWAKHNAEARPLIAQLNAWEQKTPRSDSELAIFQGVCQDAEASVKKLRKLLPTESQRHFLRRLQDGEATLTEAAKLMDWLEEIGLTKQLCLRLGPQQADAPTEQD